MSETKRLEMMKIHGSRHCRQIIFEAQTNPARAVLYHCIDCQMMSGSSYRSIVQVKEADLSLLAGEPKPYFKVGDSGNGRELSFCANCGSHFYATLATADVPKGQARSVSALVCCANWPSYHRMLRFGASLMWLGQMIFPTCRVWTRSPKLHCGAAS